MTAVKACVSGGDSYDRSPKRLRYRIRREAYGEASSRAEAVGLAAGHKDGGENAALRRQVEQLKDQCLRARSDLENFRKRSARERDEQRKYAGETVIKSLLETVDNLERAVQGAEQTNDFKALHSGVEMIHQQFVAALGRHGVETIEAKPGAKFDPAYHQAVMTEAKPGAGNDTIIECLQSGYLLNGRVLRAAMVKVARNS